MAKQGVSMSAGNSQSAATIMMIFGGAGDLTWRKLVPSLFTLFIDGCLPDELLILGVDVKGMTDDDYRQRLLRGVGEFSRKAEALPARWESFASKIAFVSADFMRPEIYGQLKDRIGELNRAWKTKANTIFYMAVPPFVLPTVVQNLGQSGLAADRKRARIIVEKPFGHDLDSARALDMILRSVFEESQIYRIDHFLGKETVQNLLAFRFGNAIFEPLWNRRYIDNVQITVAEDLGIGHRGPYYEKAGALRDMVQNHLLQILCLVAMEPPVSFNADQIRNRTVDVLHAIRVLPEGGTDECVVRGQYAAGTVGGSHVPGYRDEPDVSPGSSTETFVAARFFVDNWRWQDVPFYLRTGKRLAARVSEVSIEFRPVPHRSFPASAAEHWPPNRIAVRIQPKEGIVLRIEAKRPGQPVRLVPVDMLFDYQESFKTVGPDAYETLLIDVMMGDATLFMRADQIETAWSVVTPILEHWEHLSPPAFPNYPAGSWGPREADDLLARDGRAWLTPTVLDGP
jgi:glucose-6-phosphate 1-dehydrogenase